MNILTMEQGSPEWLAARIGILSASNFDKIITSKGERSSQFPAYALKLAVEIITGEREEIFINDAMNRGIEMEPDARACYEFIADVTVKEVGMVLHDSGVSCSPDGLIFNDNADDEGVEFKCPMAHTHIKYVIDNKLPAKYVPQVQGSMYVTGLKKWDFLSYHPSFKHLFVNVPRDDEFCDKLEILIDKFHKKVAEIISKYDAA